MIRKQNKYPGTRRTYHLQIYHLQIDHLQIDHLQIDHPDLNLPLSDVVQDLYGTYPTQEACPTVV